MTAIAVSGATGFVGRHVLAELALHETRIVAIARPGRTSLPILSKGEWIHLDIAQPPANTWDMLGKPDVLIHLAWEGLPNYRSLHHFEAELPLQYAFLKKLIMQGLKSLVVTGTCFEYGMQSGPLSESTETRPSNPYGFAKDALRQQLQYLQELQPFNLSWARLFYMYGEGQAETALLPLLRKAIAQQAAQFNMSGGEQLRDYLSVTEVAHYLVQLALKKKNVGSVNVCSGRPQSVRSLVEKWIRENQWNIHLNLGHYPYQNYEPMAFWGDSTRLRETLTPTSEK